MKVKTVKQGNYIFLSINNIMICAFNELEKQFIRCTTVGITEKIIKCVNDFRNKYNLESITMEYFLNEFI